MRKQSVKRWLSVLICMAMLVTNISIPVFAEEPTAVPAAEPMAVPAAETAAEPTAESTAEPDAEPAAEPASASAPYQ